MYPNPTGTNRTDHSEHQIARYIDTYASPIIFFFGSIGNTLILIVYCRRRQREKPLSIYIRSLAVADTFMLILFFAQWLTSTSHHPLSQFSCKVTNFLSNWNFNVCEYIVVAITLSRLLAIVFPMRAVITKIGPKVNVTSIVVVSFLVNLCDIWTIEYTVHVPKDAAKVTHACLRKQQSSRVLTFVMWLKATICFIVPMLVIFFANLLILRELKKRKRSQPVQRKNDRKEENKVTIMLVVMTCTFFVLLLPYIAFRWYEYFINSHKSDTKSRGVLDLIRVVCVKLLYSNNAVGFYVYALFNSDVRKELKRIVMKSDHRIHPSYVE